ncbi:MAG: hypothetical protein HKN34_03495 [Gammaproteobacteria bacterium]|nr:hypothetical protein [Gammaproteobacteria bacterium]
MAVNFDVIIPGLLQLPIAELGEDVVQNRFPALSHILRFSRRSSSAMFDFEAMLADSLGLLSSNLPFASGFDDDYTASQSLLCQAVHFKPDMRNAFIVSLHESDRTTEQISRIINDLAHYFKKDFTLSNINEKLWLMRLKHCQVDIQYPHILSVIGRKADPYIQQSRETLEWYKLSNEIQMFMHSHEVNQQRLQEGLPAINSLWCWGGGEVTPLSRTDMRVYCDDFLVNAFLTRSGLMPENPQGISDRDFGQDSIYLDLGLLRALKDPRGDDIHCMLENIENRVLQPLVDGVSAGRLKLRLRVGHEFDFELNRLSSLKFWRKPANLKTVIE